MCTLVCWASILSVLNVIHCRSHPLLDDRDNRFLKTNECPFLVKHYKTITSVKASLPLGSRTTALCAKILFQMLLFCENINLKKMNIKKATKKKKPQKLIIQGKKWRKRKGSTFSSKLQSFGGRHEETPKKLKARKAIFSLNSTIHYKQMKGNQIIICKIIDLKYGFF